MQERGYLQNPYASMSRNYGDGNVMQIGRFYYQLINYLLYFMCSKLRKAKQVNPEFGSIN